MKKFIYSIIFIFSFCANLLAQERPKIGVVLSGGGAKGFAHIGVLQTLEDAGIKPDYVTGTSMGAIIGALYSIGYSPKEINQIASEINWNTVLGNNIRLDRVSIEEKAFFGRYLTELTIKDKNIYLPTALIEGQNLQMLLSKLTQPVHHINCFDSLPIPFACVAADIENGEPILLDEGNLAQALRASMAIPTVFTPVERDGRVLVDGGLIRNFPVEEVKNMGADIVIGSYVGGEFKSRHELNTFTDILKQSAFITSIFDSRNQAKLCDVYIQPELKGYSAADFNASDSIALIGYRDSRPYFEKLRELADSVYANEPPIKLIKPIITDTFMIDSVIIHGNKYISDKLIRGRLQLKKNRKYSLTYIEERINKDYGIQYFDRISYSLVPLKNNKHQLHVFVKEKPKTNLKIALHYDTETNAGILFNVTSRNLFLSGSKLTFELDFATQPRLNLRYLKYIGKKQLWALSIGGNWVRQSKIPAVNIVDQESLYTGNFLGLYVGAQSTFSTNLTFGTKFERNLNNFSPKVNADSILGNIWEFNYGLNYYVKYNSTDHINFPTKGVNLSANLFQRISTQQDFEFITDRLNGVGISGFQQETPPYTSIIAKIDHYFTFKDKITLSYFGYLNQNFIDEPSFTGSSFFGGVNPIIPNSVPFYGDLPYSFISDDVIIVGGRIRYNITHQLFVSGIGNIADSELTARAKNEEIDGINFGAKEVNSVFGGGVELAYNSFFGPIRLVAMQHNHTKTISFYFGVGFKFR